MFMMSDVSGFLDQGCEGCEDWGSVSGSVWWRRIRCSEEVSWERRVSHQLTPRHHCCQLSRILLWSSLQFRAHCCLPRCRGFLFGFLFKVQAFGLILVRVEEKIAASRHIKQQQADNKILLSKPTETVYYIQHSVPPNIEDKILLFFYNRNKQFILCLHLLKQMSFEFSI